MIMYENNRVLLKIITAMHDYKDNRVFIELLYKTFSKIDMSKVKNKSKTYVSVILNMSEAIMRKENKNEIDDDFFEEVIQECKTRENGADLENVRNSFGYQANDRDIEAIMKHCETFNKSLIINAKRSEIIEKLAASTSFMDMPKHTKDLENTFRELSTQLSSETVHKSHRELVMLPGSKEIEGLTEIYEDVQRESSIVLKTGIKGFDEVILRGGIFSGKLTIIGSYAGGGKSITMLELLVGIMLCPENRNLYNLAEFKNKKIVVMIVTYENTLLQTYRRLMKLLGFSGNYIDSLSFNELKRLMGTILENAPIGLIIKAKDARSESAEDIVNYIKEVEEKHNCYVACIGHDYINLTNPVKVSNNGNEFMDAGQVAEELREKICKALNKPVISAIQVKREWEDKYVDAVRKGDKMPVRVFTGASIFGGNIIKQKVDNLIFVVYSILNGTPYTEVILDKDRDGNAQNSNDVEIVNRNLGHLADEYAKQKFKLNEIRKDDEKSIKDFYGSDGRLAIAIPRAGLAFRPEEYYADRFEINPEASKFMNMFQVDANEDKVLPKEVYEPDEMVKEIEDEVPYSGGEIIPTKYAA